MKNRFDFKSLEWHKTYLTSYYYTKNSDLKCKKSTDFFDIEGNKTNVLTISADRGKITDSGYDQMECVYSKIPLRDIVIFHAKISIDKYPDVSGRNGQEGTGLFLRDTLDLDPETGYPLSNMAAAGAFHGCIGAFGREGADPGRIKKIRNFCLNEGKPVNEYIIGQFLDITLAKTGAHLEFVIRDEQGKRSGFDFFSAGDMFSSRDKEYLYFGLMAARGCEISADMDSFYIDACDFSDVLKDRPVIYAVAEQGKDSGSIVEGVGYYGAGTIENPMDLQQAIDHCIPGQEIHVLPGVYHMTDSLVIRDRNNGAHDLRKKLTAADVSSGNGNVVLDFADTGADRSNVVLDFGGTDSSFIIEGDYWDISGLTVTGGFGFQVRGNHNKIHDCVAHHNLETGFLIRHADNESDDCFWPSHNEISDCVSFCNKDFSEQNADGFACKVSAGPGNRFVRCVSFLNSDDGFDLFSKYRPSGAVSLIGCRSFFNGYIPDDADVCFQSLIESDHSMHDLLEKLLAGEIKLRETGGNGNGFKLGGSGHEVRNEVVDCEAIGNRQSGFTSNSNPYMMLVRCKAGDNKINYNYYFTGPNSKPVRKLINCEEFAECLRD